jgi:uncharacterized protein YmfQ (DUF2313 family)
MQNFQHVLKSLLPRGDFWEFGQKSVFNKILQALGEELNRASTRVEALPSLLELRSSLERYLELLSLGEKNLKGVRAQEEALASLLSRGGNLSRAYLERRLNAWGYQSFRVDDPTEDDLGLNPTLNPEWNGRVFFHKKIEEMSELRAGFFAGAGVRDWINPHFEEDVRSLLAAQIEPIFLYQEGDF